MRKVLLFFCLLLFPIKAQAISASSYIIMDMDSGLVLGGSNIHKQNLIASISKIMTCYIALNYGNLNDVIEVGDEILKAYGSAIYIEIGERLTLNNLLYGLMLRSGNDASYVIAKYISGNMTEFANLMNATAEALGMKNTHFYNAHGLEENNGKGNISTVYDMAILTKEAMKNKNYRKIVKTKSVVAKTSYKSYTWYNKNRLLSEYKYTTGGKTGYTKKAKRTLVTTASKDNKNLIIVTFNDSNDFNDHKILYDNFFKNYEKVNILDKDDYQVNDTYYSKYTLYIKESYSALIKKNNLSNLRIEETIEKLDKVRNNEKIGTVSVYLKNKLIHTENIYLSKKIKVKKDSFWIRLIRKVKSWLM